MRAAMVAVVRRDAGFMSRRRYNARPRASSSRSLGGPALSERRACILRRVPEGDRSLMRWRMLAVLSLAELLGMSLWFAAAAVAPQLRVQWGLDAARVGWLTNAVQLGFVAGTAVASVLNLADLVPA